MQFLRFSARQVEPTKTTLCYVRPISPEFMLYSMSVHACAQLIFYTMVHLNNVNIVEKIQVGTFVR